MGKYLNILGVLILLCGCGGSDRPSVYPVTGHVLYRGQPVQDAEVTFLPAKGPIASGKTDAQGQFRLSTFVPEDGAVAGEHTVLISKKEKYVDPKMPNSPYEMSRDVLPVRYGSASTSPLKETVKPNGPNQFTFELTN